MCIIVYKPAGVKFPSMDILKQCFENNSDGAGFMYPSPTIATKCDKIYVQTRGKVTINKGYMLWKEFEDGFNSVFLKEDGTYDCESPVVFHFRIRTHGKSDAGATQPIAVSNKTAQLRATSTQVSVGVAHNGIITKFCDAKSKLSDSQIYARDFLTVLKLYQDITLHKCKVIRDSIGVSNKMVVMNGKGEVAVIGNFIEDDGIFYSNGTYKKTYYVYNPTKYSYEDTDWMGKYYGYSHNRVKVGKRTALCNKYTKVQDYDY